MRGNLGVAFGENMYFLMNSSTSFNENEKISDEAVGQRIDEYKEKVVWLKKRWPSDPQRDGVAERVIRPIIYFSVAPLYQALNYG